MNVYIIANTKNTDLLPIEKLLKNSGYDVINPQKRVNAIKRHNVMFNKKTRFKDILLKNCEIICNEADGYYLVKNYEQSTTALVEEAIAKAIKLPKVKIFSVKPLE